MKKPYMAAMYEVIMFNQNVGNIVTLSSDRENAYIPTGPEGGIWNDFDFDDDD